MATVYFEYKDKECFVTINPKFKWCKMLVMKKIYLFLLLIFTPFVFAQEDAWIYFNTKSNTESFLVTPLQMLSQRALDRRANQNIALDSKDVPIDKTYISQIKAVSGIAVLAKSKWLNAIHVRGTQAVINSLKTFVFVSKIDFANKTLNQTGKMAKNRRLQTVDKVVETEINYDYGNSANQIKMLSGNILHQQNYTGSGKIIAILDAGFPGVDTAQPFEKLIVNNKILGGYDYVKRSPNFYTGNNHGTMVLSTIGGYKANSLVGTAPDASFYLFRTEDAVTENPVEESLWVEAAEKADSLGVDIINTSLGYFKYDNPSYNHTYSEMNGITAFMSRGAEIAFSRGMFIVAAAGNEGGSGDPYIGVPADAVSVLTIGAVNSAKSVASFSSIGPSSDGRIKPDVMAQGQTTVVSNEFGTITTSNGTSFSSPIMAGMVACLWQAFPDKTNKEIRDLIVQSADRFAAPTNEYGYGIPNFSLSLSKGLGENVLSKNDFMVYPNLTSDLVSVQFPNGYTMGTAIIYSILGQVVLEKNIVGQEATTISLKALNKGMYFYKVESNGYSETGKIIKQ